MIEKPIWVGRVSYEATGKIADKLIETQMKVHTLTRLLEKYIAQLAELRKAEEAQQKFHSEMTQEKWNSLTKRPEWENCNHLKGGKIKPVYKDYALLAHRLPNLEWKIWCMICGKPFSLDDPETKEMLKHSSNVSSASESTIQWKKVSNGPDNLSQ